MDLARQPAVMDLAIRQDYILERGIVADLSIVKAWKADPSGNLIFRKTARNFNPPAATCGRVCVAEVEDIVPLGSLDPDHIHLPGIYVHRIVQGTHEKRIERLHLVKCTRGADQGARGWQALPMTGFPTEPSMAGPRWTRTQTAARSRMSPALCGLPPPTTPIFTE
ncbi:MAG: CoA-transferase [Mycobacterium sp.]|nr:CoA-transferase [Mycobacterium sp.]